MQLPVLLSPLRAMSAALALAAALGAGPSTAWAQPAQRGHGAAPAAEPRVDQRAELRRDVVDGQSRRVEDEGKAHPARQLSPEQRAELRRQLREQVRVPSGRTGNAP